MASSLQSQRAQLQELFHRLEIAHKFVEAADAYGDHPEAMNLRTMNMLHESIVKRGLLMVVPSLLADSLYVPSLMGFVGGVDSFRKMAALAKPLLRW